MFETFSKTVSSSVSSEFRSPWARSSDPCHFSEVENVQARMLEFAEQLDQDLKQIGLGFCDRLF